MSYMKNGKFDVDLYRAKRLELARKVTDLFTSNPPEFALKNEKPASRWLAAQMAVAEDVLKCFTDVDTDGDVVKCSAFAGMEIRDIQGALYHLALKTGKDAEFKANGLTFSITHPAKPDTLTVT